MTGRELKAFDSPLANAGMDLKDDARMRQALIKMLSKDFPEILESLGIFAGKKDDKRLILVEFVRHIQASGMFLVANVTMASHQVSDFYPNGTPFWYDRFVSHPTEKFIEYLLLEKIGINGSDILGEFVLYLMKVGRNNGYKNGQVSMNVVSSESVAAAAQMSITSSLYSSLVAHNGKSETIE